MIQAPSPGLTEVLYSVSRDTDVRGVTLTGSPEDARHALIGNGPVSLASVDEAELREYVQIVDEFSIHDGLIVASHRAQGTAAIITTDGVMTEAGYETVSG